LYRKSKLLGSVLILGLYVLNLIFTWGPFPDDAHLITGVSMFWLGMMLYHFQDRLEKLPWHLWVSVLVVAVLLFAVELPGPLLLRKNVMALCIFIIIMRLGVFLRRENPVIGFLSKIEYGIYLCHHAVLYVMQSFFLKVFEEVKPVPYYILSLVATLVFAAVLTYLTGWILKLFRGKETKGGNVVC
jgi:peptidoglycan/LPS O-acetylase OafA/YrhL